MLLSLIMLHSLLKYKLALPSLHSNHLPISYTDSIKYLGYIFTSDNSDGAEMLRQMEIAILQIDQAN